MGILHGDVEQFFDRYVRAFNDALNGTIAASDMRALYSTQFIAAGPQEVMAGDNDEAFAEQMAKGYEQYRRIGTKTMAVTAVDVHPIDETHCLAHVGFLSTFEKDGEPIDIAFTNAYLLQDKDGALKVFGWITGDEAQVLKDHGLM